MTLNHSLDIVVQDKIKPLLDTAMHKYLGITVKEIEKDITDQIKRSPLIDFVIDPNLLFKKAKDEFKRQYVMKVLRSHFGNVSAAAENSGLDRRSIHRLIAHHRIDLEQFRKVLLRPAYIKQTAVNEIITRTLDNYKQVINADRLSKFYNDSTSLSKDIVRELPDIHIPLAVAEQEFERRYFEQVLLIYKGRTAEIAKKIGLRYETLHRKLKSLGLD
ncbi:hypothetical protein HY641_00960 [Candidatus Woesearchaeota archaeon]|nr:hypothetical protein [Candidatus Woesearchaeota archaeon]